MLEYWLAHWMEISDLLVRSAVMKARGVFLPQFIGSYIQAVTGPSCLEARPGSLHMP